MPAVPQPCQPTQGRPGLPHSPLATLHPGRSPALKLRTVIVFVVLRSQASPGWETDGPLSPNPLPFSLVGSLGLAWVPPCTSCLFYPCARWPQACWPFLSEDPCPMAQAAARFPSAWAHSFLQQHGPSAQDGLSAPCSGPPDQCPAWQSLSVFGISLPSPGSHHIRLSLQSPRRAPLAGRVLAETPLLHLLR